MSSDVAISVRGLNKTYRIVDVRQRATTLAEAIGQRLRHPFRWGPRQTFQALRDINFEVRRGEVIGIIGRNGAGKSTLLKILSRITDPTSGEADIYGRTGSLLEVGTGFHPELTGRENIFLNGGILGMSREKIRRRFDEIVDFAGVEQFLDTPVKRYSSGMYVRLAFAVAAHLDPEVLIVDEVLAVGDAAFQKKCLGKMNETVQSGRTVLFVSHNMGTIQALCPRAIVLREGEMAFDGGVDEAVRIYLADLEEAGSLATDVSERQGTGEVEITGVSLIGPSGEPTTAIVGGQDVSLEIAYTNHTGRRHPRLIANLYDSRGRPVTSFGTHLTAPDLGELGRRGRFVCHLPRLPLLPGTYRIALAIHVDGITVDTLKAAAVFEVASSLFYDTGATPSDEQATFLIDHAWSHEPLPDGATGGERSRGLSAVGGER